MSGAKKSPFLQRMQPGVNCRRQKKKNPLLLCSQKRKRKSPFHFHLPFHPYRQKMRMKVDIILLFSSLSAFFSRVPERTFFLSAQKIIGRSKPFRICFSQTKTIWPRGTRYVSYLGQGIWVMFFEFRRRSSTFPKKRGRGRQGFIREKIYWGKHRACVVLHAFFPSPAPPGWVLHDSTAQYVLYFWQPQYEHARADFPSYFSG